MSSGVIQVRILLIICGLLCAEARVKPVGIICFRAIKFWIQ